MAERLRRPSGLFRGLFRGGRWWPASDFLSRVFIGLFVLIESLELSDYEVGDILGVGTVGTIYAAKRISDRSPVAIKRLHPGVSNDPNIRARFEREMLILQRLRHPNIIRYDGGGVTEGQLFYVMELVNGGTVKDLLERSGRIQWPVVVELTRQICSALQCAHNHGVVHRDLKPGNLFLTRQGDLKLGDFGIARDQHNSDLTSSGMTVGTHAYMAPEQITGDNRISGKADLYALGCCIYEMLAGKKVFAGENFAQLFEQHLRSNPPSILDEVPDCPAPLDEIIRQLLAKDPEDRPFNARSVQGVMNELENDRMRNAESTKPSGAPERTGDKPSQKPEAGQATAANSNTSMISGQTGHAHDVAADAVDGRSMLQREIAASIQSASPEVSLKRLLAVVVMIIVLIIAATWLGG